MWTNDLTTIDGRQFCSFVSAQLSTFCTAQSSIVLSSNSACFLCLHWRLRNKYNNRPTSSYASSMWNPNQWGVTPTFFIFNDHSRSCSTYVSYRSFGRNLPNELIQQFASVQCFLKIFVSNFASSYFRRIGNSWRMNTFSWWLVPI